MRALVGGIPRALKSHRSRAGRAYAAYTRAIVSRLGDLPPSARTWLREAGLTSLELEQIQAEMQELFDKPRRRHEFRRLQRRRISLRSQLLSLEKRIEELAAAARKQKPTPADLVARLRGGDHA